MQETGCGKFEPMLICFNLRTETESTEVLILNHHIWNVVWCSINQLSKNDFYSAQSEQRYIDCS